MVILIDKPQAKARIWFNPMTLVFSLVSLAICTSVSYVLYLAIKSAADMFS